MTRRHISRICAFAMILVLVDCKVLGPKTSCKPGTYPFEWLDECRNCPTGEFKMCTSQGDCQWCPPNFYQDEEGQITCKECPFGTVTRGYTRAESKNACVGCPASTYYSRTLRAIPLYPKCLIYETYERNCLPCGQTEPKNGYGAFEKSSKEGSISADQCNEVVCHPGSYFDSKLGACLYCERGSYSDTGVQEVGACKPCAAGLYQDDIGATGCKACWKGTYSLAGSDYCPPCPPGTVNDNDRAQGCNPCYWGMYQDEPGQTKCKRCPKGVYYPAIGSASCIDCPKGAFKVNPNITTLHGAAGCAFVPK